VQHTFFRIIQEALANIYKHAGAKTASVSLVSRRGALQVRIADDGKGIGGVVGGRIEDVPLGVGVSGMKARMAQLGGALRIESRARGTVVTGLLRRTRVSPDAASVGHPMRSA
jgi:signal transduction histidine kinase